MSTATLEQETAAPAIIVTPAAIKQVNRLIAKKDGAAPYLRIGVKGGGCSGLSYVIRLEEQPNDNDFAYEFDGLKTLVDPRSAQFIDGLTLDYSLANLLEGGWKFENPNAAKSCGCGTSFTPRG